jgi:hypothetical protein
MKAAKNEKQRSLCLTRLAELHLDLATRIRQIPLPLDSSADQAGHFQANLVQHALPMEVLAQGLLAQSVRIAEHAGRENRFTRRARVYLALHFDAGTRQMPNAHFRRLWREGDKQATFAPPSRLMKPLAVGAVRGRNTARAQTFSSGVQ